MPEKKLILITGRSTKQGTGISTGKEKEDYQVATSILELNPLDMQSFGLSQGQAVTIKTQFGQARAICQPQDLPEGLAFMAFGPATSHLLGGETHATGMPDSKGFEIELEKIPA
ncbi:MAG: molybdopterin dinucleotide binding domain-containing protein [Anaerolineales bacterium]|jgi:formylmethanofuran dehydrogenase subunit D